MALDYTITLEDRVAIAQKVLSTQEVEHYSLELAKLSIESGRAEESEKLARLSELAAEQEHRERTIARLKETIAELKSRIAERDEASSEPPSSE